MKRDLFLQRRKNLSAKIGKGLALFIGNNEVPMNYNANCYHFRQDSTFLYFFGLDLPGLVGIIDLETGQSTLFGDNRSVDDVIWMGDCSPLEELAESVGIDQVLPTERIASTLQEALQKRRKIHFLPFYQYQAQLSLQKWLGICVQVQKYYASEELIRAIVDLREIKSEEEISEIRRAVEVSAHCYKKIRDVLRPGLFEYQIVAECEYISTLNGCRFSFIPIVTRNGQILHNHYYGNRLEDGDMLLIDSGVETALGYASDITRTLPVSGTFSKEQRQIYDLVLKMQLSAIEMIRPGVSYRDVHLRAAQVLIEGLKEIGLMRGKSEDAVAAGAHALFFPHGLGHMLGLDVHDMENLGENYVGYDQTISRSEQFGLAYLRLAKKLQPGFVLTVEPGIYFIPALITQWKKQGLHQEFIDYERVQNYLHFGGIRIEDDILVTSNGYENLSAMIAK